MTLSISPDTVFFDRDVLRSKALIWTWWWRLLKKTCASNVRCSEIRARITMCMCCEGTEESRGLPGLLGESFTEQVTFQLNFEGRGGISQTKRRRRRPGSPDPGLPMMRYEECAMNRELARSVRLETWTGTRLKNCIYRGKEKRLQSLSTEA